MSLYSISTPLFVFCLTYTNFADFCYIWMSLIFLPLYSLSVSIMKAHSKTIIPNLRFLYPTHIWLSYLHILLVVFCILVSFSLPIILITNVCALIDYCDILDFQYVPLLFKHLTLMFDVQTVKNRQWCLYFPTSRYIWLAEIIR